MAIEILCSGLVADQNGSIKLGDIEYTACAKISPWDSDLIITTVQKNNKVMCINYYDTNNVTETFHFFRC